MVLFSFVALETILNPNFSKTLNPISCFFTRAASPRLVDECYAWSSASEST